MIALQETLNHMPLCYVSKKSGDEHFKYYFSQIYQIEDFIDKSLALHSLQKCVRNVVWINFEWFVALELIG